MKKALLFFTLIFFSRTLLAQMPTITSFSPVNGKPGDAVTITGTNFNTTTTNNVVFFGATKATVTAANATSLTVTVPSGATYAPITLLNTANSLVAQSLSNFNPIFSPAKANITNSDFSSVQSFTAGTNPFSVAIGDLDGDGKSDLAVINLNSNNVSIFHNTSSSGAINSSSFAAKVDFAIGFSPVFVAIGDLDGDGKPDLSVVNQGSNSISILRNTSTSGSITSSSFAAKVDFNTEASPTSLAIGDLDGDGKPDLLVTSQNSNIVSVFRNTSTNGSITIQSFAGKVDFPTEANPSSVALGDLDGDDKTDFVVTNQNSNNVSLFRNTSTSGTITSSSFAAKVNFTTGTNPTSIAIGDLDGDGKPDLAVANRASNNVSILYNTSNIGAITSSSFAEKVDFATSNFPYSVAIGDLDGDNKADLAVANFNSNSISIFRNSSTSGSITTSSFAAKVDFATGDSPLSVAIGDLDGDSKPDLAVANLGSNNVSVFRNTDVLPPTITSFSPLNAKPGDAVTIIGTNFNTTATNNVVFFGATKATVTAASATSLTVTVPLGATYDFITLLNSEISLATQSLKKFNPIFAPAKTNITLTDFSPKQDFTAGTNPISVVHADLDGDGKPDLIVSNNNENTISIYHNTSSNGSINSASYTSKVDFATGSNPFFISISDIDGDGKPDIIVPNSNSSSISIFRNTSTTGSISSSSFAARVDFTLGSSTPLSVAIGDLDGDGKVDIATSNVSGSQNNISVLRNTSTAGNITSASFAPKVDFFVGFNPYTIVAADLDGDGKLDLATANFGSNNISVLRNTSTTGSINSSSFASKVDFITSDLPAFLNVGDLDGDGKSDLVVTNFNSNDFSVFHNTSTTGSITSGSFAAKVDFTTGSTSSSIAIGDLNGDGKPDLAVVNGGQNTVSLYRNVSSTGSITSGSFSPKIDFITGGGPQSVAIGDLDGDGKPDLAVANNSVNNISILRNTDIVLPVTLINYTAKLNTNGTVQLHWLTASETNNSHFEILKSTDGKNFSSIAKVNGSGNSTQQTQYDYTDTRPSSGSNYYQLIQYDDNGKQTDLGVRAVNVTLGSKELTVYPNPASSLINLSFEADVYQKLEVIDLTGKILISQTIQKQENSISLDINKLSTGFYHIRLTGTGKITTKQIIKQ
ncbi:FG-GAP-like repeat-containing protein [Pedobacter glucosidilyticus]|uniref:FG-GAP-like repeat-containing protein n=1 Tax=Pedobacter glucosidilyticus TaxID=1122941 RepID=UPI00047BDEF3|nr:FG-GAP-like repeat-containing protein [Pedobacter glucosidilyticus]